MEFHSHKLLGGAAVLVLLGVSVAEAQERAGSFEQLRPRVAAGDEVTVTDVMGRKTHGRILELSSSSLVLVANKTRTELVEADVETVSRRDSRWNGTLSGLGVGGVLGVLLDRSLVDEYGRDDTVGFVYRYGGGDRSWDRIRRRCHAQGSASHLFEAADLDHETHDGSANVGHPAAGYRGRLTVLMTREGLECGPSVPPVARARFPFEAV